MSETLVISAENSEEAIEAIKKILGVKHIEHLKHHDIIGVLIDTKEEALRIQEEINRTVPGILSNTLSGKVFTCD